MWREAFIIYSIYITCFHVQTFTTWPNVGYLTMYFSQLMVITCPSYLHFTTPLQCNALHLQYFGLLFTPKLENHIVYGRRLTETNQLHITRRNAYKWVTHSYIKHMAVTSKNRLAAANQTDSQKTFLKGNNKNYLIINSSPDIIQ